MDEMVRLRGHHTLDIVLEVAQHNAEPLRGARAPILGVEGLDLETLKDGDGELLLCAIGIIEHGAIARSQSLSYYWMEVHVKKPTPERPV